MTSEDLGLIGLSVDGINIKGYCILGADNQLNIESTAVITEDKGWFLEEEFSVEVVLPKPFKSEIDNTDSNKGVFGKFFNMLKGL